MPEPLHRAAAALVGEAAAREALPSDAVAGVVPRVVVEPGSAGEVGALLAWASRDGLTVVPCGARTKIAWGSAPRAADVLLSTRRLDAVVAHRHGDLTATVQAGAPLGAVNRALAAHRQWIPLDPPFADRATIGGLVATNDSGPRRHRYGAPRDLIIGIELARADGRLAKGGGIVVKNVAGYDLPRLMTGSFGSLGVIVSATFKLYPLTAASATLIVHPASFAELGTLATALNASHLTPTAVEFLTSPLRLAIRFESIQESVDRQVEAAASLIQRASGAQRLSGAEETAWWEQTSRFGEAESGTLIKVSTLPTRLAAVLETIERTAGPDGFAAAGRAAAGVFLVRLDGVSQAAAVAAALRDQLPPGQGSAVVVRAPDPVRSAIDVWGSVGDGLPLMKAVKRQFDPAGLLSPGRGPGGL